LNIEIHREAVSHSRYHRAECAASFLVEHNGARPHPGGAPVKIDLRPFLQIVPNLGGPMISQKGGENRLPSSTGGAEVTSDGNGKT